RPLAASTRKWPDSIQDVVEFLGPRIDQLEVTGPVKRDQFRLIFSGDCNGNVVLANFERHTAIASSVHEFLRDSERKQLDWRSDAVAAGNFFRTTAEQISDDSIAQV